MEAIYGAVLDELSEHGYAAFSIERIAERARTGKASIYRRWHNRVELITDALDHAMPFFDELPDTGSIRGDLIVVLGDLAACLNDRATGAARACLAGGEPELMALMKERVLPPRKARMVDLLRRAAERGEIRADAATPRVAEVGPMLLTAEFVHRGGPVEPGTVTAIVDEVLLPLLRV
ncbi:MAG: TetR/AcrR family transcriptional regulator [Acidimicrobiales bacterium]